MRATLRATILAAVAVLAAGACSAGGDDPAGEQPRGRDLVEALGLSPAVEPCLDDGLATSDAARAGLSPEASDDQRQALGELVVGCVPADEFAVGVAALLAGGYRAVTAVSDDDERCFAEQVAALPIEDRALFVVGPLAGQGSSVSDQSVAAGELVDRVVRACGVAPTTGTTGA